MKNFIALGLILIGGIALAQQLKDLTLDQAVLPYYNGLYPKYWRNLQWVKGGAQGAYSFINNDTLIVSRYTGKDEAVGGAMFTKKQVSVGMASELKRFPNIKWHNADEFRFQFKNKAYSFNLDKMNSSTILSLPSNFENVDFADGMKLAAYTIGNKLFIATAKDSMLAVTEHSDTNVVSGQAIHRFEFGISKGTFWSPDASALAFYEKDESNVANYPLLDITTTPGSLVNVKYPMAGQESEHGNVGIYSLITKKVVYLEKQGGDEDYVTNVTWGPEGNFIYVAELDRGQNHLHLNKFDAKSGKFIKTLFEEKGDKWVEPENGLFFLPNSSSEFIWLSERDGFMNLYQYNTDGKLIKQVTNFKWVVDDIVGFTKKEVLVSGTGPDPKQLHCYKVNLKNGKVTQLTKEPGSHSVNMNKAGTYLIDNFSSSTVAARTNVINVKKRKSTVLNKIEDPLVGYKIGQCEFVELSAEDGTKLHGRLIKPRDFDQNKKYPVLVYVYGGPHAQLVTDSWMGGASLWMHWLANKDYLVFTVDGRGSKHRGFEFESAIFRQLGQLEMKDQITGIDYLKTLDYVNKDRIAVHGWSFGGFMTISLMLNYPDQFTTGVSGGPVIDWKWYEVMYGERYMDTPNENPDGYKKTSLLQNVKNLQGDLLLIHGTSDDVVVMQHNLAFVKKCVSEGVQVDFFPYPMHRHNVRGKDRAHLMEKVLNYVIEHNK